MRLCQLLKLSHAEFTARKKTIFLSILAAGIPLILILGISFVNHGIEQLFLPPALAVTDGQIFFAVETNPGSTSLPERVQKFGGEVLEKITPELLDNSDKQNATEVFAAIAGVNPNQLTITPNFSFYQPVLTFDSSGTEDTGFHFSNFFLNNVSTYFIPYNNDIEALRTRLAERDVYLIRFPTLSQALAYQDNVYAHSSSITMYELFSNALGTYRSFRDSNAKTMLLLRNIALFISIVIVIGTFVYLLDQDLKAMVIYRALGATTADLWLISLGYLLEISLSLIIYALLGGIIFALIISGIDSNYLRSCFSGLYNTAPPHTVLLGWSSTALWVILSVIVAAPISLLLMLDQFSVKRLSQKLKKD